MTGHRGPFAANLVRLDPGQDIAYATNPDLIQMDYHVQETALKKHFVTSNHVIQLVRIKIGS